MADYMEYLNLTISVLKLEYQMFMSEICGIKIGL